MKNFFFSLIVGFFFLIILYLSLNSDFRRSILSLSMGLVNNYYSITIYQDLKSENGFEKSIKRINQQIKITDFLTTDQKNSFIDQTPSQKLKKDGTILACLNLKNLV